MSSQPAGFDARSSGVDRAIPFIEGGIVPDGDPGADQRGDTAIAQRRLAEPFLELGAPGAVFPAGAGGFADTRAVAESFARCWFGCACGYFTRSELPVAPDRLAVEQ